MYLYMNIMGIYNYVLVLLYRHNNVFISFKKVTVKIPKTSLNVFISYKSCPFELSVDQIFLKKVYTINLSSTIGLSTDDKKDKIFL